MHLRVYRQKVRFTWKLIIFVPASLSNGWDFMKCTHASFKIPKWAAAYSAFWDTNIQPAPGLRMAGSDSRMMIDHVVYPACRGFNMMLRREFWTMIFSSRSSWMRLWTKGTKRLYVWSQGRYLGHIVSAAFKNSRMAPRAQGAGGELGGSDFCSPLPCISIKSCIHRSICSRSPGILKRSS